jgi:hypothetical protein
VSARAQGASGRGFICAGSSKNCSSAMFSPFQLPGEFLHAGRVSTVALPSTAWRCGLPSAPLPTANSTLL